MTTKFNLQNQLPLIIKGQGLVGSSVGVCTPMPVGKNPTTVSAVIDWSSYGVAAGTPLGPVAINLQGGATNPIDAIRSIKIDNLGCFSACTVYFPDTGDEVICASYSSIVANVMTGGLQCLVLMDAQTGNNGTTTTVFFNNFMSNPVELNSVLPVSLAERSSGAPFSLNTLTIPAMGDKFQQYEIDLTLTGVASRIPIFGLTAPTAIPNNPPAGFNFIVIKNMYVDLYENYIASATLVKMNVGIYNDLGTAFFNFPWVPRNDLDAYDIKRIYEFDSSQQPLSSAIGVGISRKYFLQNDVAGLGFARVGLTYTLVNQVNF